jgi:triphosphoribosyl-dephospho-CoA synthetase
VLHHHLQELDDDLRRRADEHLPPRVARVRTVGRGVLVLAKVAPAAAAASSASLLAQTGRGLARHGACKRRRTHQQLAKHLALATALGVGDRVQRVVKNTDAHHLRNTPTSAANPESGLLPSAPDQR